MVGCIVFSLPTPRFLPFSYGLLLKGVTFISLLVIVRDKILPLRLSEFVLILLLIIISSISLINSAGLFVEGLNNNGVRNEFNNLIKGLSLFFIIILFYRSEARMINLLLVFLFLGTFLAVCSQLDTNNAFLNLFFDKSRMEEGLGQRSDVVFKYAPEGFQFYRTTFFSMDANYLGTLMAFTVLLSYFFFRLFKELPGRHRWLIFLLSSAPALITLASSGSRGGYLQLLAGFALLYYIMNRPSPLRLILSIFSIVLLGAILFQIGDNVLASKIAKVRILDMVSPMQGSHTDVLSAYLNEQNSIGKRLLNAQYAVEYFFSEKFNLFVGGGVQQIPYPNHIGYVIWFTKYGILGLAGYIGLGYVIIRRLISDIGRLKDKESKNDDLSLVSLSLGLLTIISVMLLSSPPPLSLWVIFGIASAVHHEISSTFQKRSSA